MYTIIETPERLYAIQENGKIIHDCLTLYKAQLIQKLLCLHQFEITKKMGPPNPEPGSDRPRESIQEP